MELIALVGLALLSSILAVGLALLVELRRTRRLLLRALDYCATCGGPHKLPSAHRRARE
jgi:hypothetical protein